MSKMGLSTHALTEKLKKYIYIEIILKLFLMFLFKFLEHLVQNLRLNADTNDQTFPRIRDWKRIIREICYLY